MTQQVKVLVKKGQLPEFNPQKLLSGRRKQLTPELSCSYISTSWYANAPTHTLRVQWGYFRPPLTIEGVSIVGVLSTPQGEGGPGHIT